ncbi:tRNA adenosine(34) deaminase TadA [Acinetobacter wuhouensis]|uniref:tRNA-specific adenosine deaminase n=1 Tax=Acinetobacter wuhouensis TaxID=1879050 RepID=A0A385C4U8_9GAMM|nr:tRNA adenosine(34) deaminase TadA [Acinetobacter wuhouensis]AXQ22659.1 tRNA adenosine(34) deaminase TadA [Acinetobacter wuhouensis]RZG44133.1 tRNA adenosine(34) deaminase TadA [Acinetobacter wuhouensis]RZG75613.1 tRNA adenosine(34) deaminase TadA [Acinetobacter wuhouensis]
MSEQEFDSQDQQKQIDEQWMQLAFEQAAFAASMGEIPVGAIIVSQNKVIGQGFNQPICQHDPTAHAEIQAIRNTCQNIENYRLPDDATLYVTLEPCTMCVGALIHARIKRVVFGALEPKAGSLVSSRQLLDTGYYNHIFQFEGGCLNEQCSSQLSDFFKMRREQKKQMKKQQMQFNLIQK